MLYLPPSFAHDGVAIDPCMTYSIGFRAPATNELAVAFLDWLRDRARAPGRYADPGLRPPASPHGSIPRCSAAAQRCWPRIRWSRADVERFLGRWLSEPKPSRLLHAARATAVARAFLARARTRGVRLDQRTQLLYDARHLYINGEALRWPAAGGAALRRLANTGASAGRAIAGRAPRTRSQLMYDWHRHGYLHPDAA